MAVVVVVLPMMLLQVEVAIVDAGLLLPLMSLAYPVGASSPGVTV